MSGNAARLYADRYAEDISLNKYADLFRGVLRTAD